MAVGAGHVQQDGMRICVRLLNPSCLMGFIIKGHQFISDCDALPSVELQGEYLHQLGTMLLFRWGAWHLFQMHSCSSFVFKCMPPRSSLSTCRPNGCYLYPMYWVQQCKSLHALLHRCAPAGWIGCYVVPLCHSTSKNRMFPSLSI